MVNHFGYCPSLRKKVDFAVSEIVDIPTSRGMKYQIKGNFEGRLCNTFCSATKAAELRTQIGSPKIYTVMEAEESQENLGQATQEESVPAIIGPSQKAYGQEGEAAEALPIAQTMPTPIISADDMSIQPIDDLSLPDATIQDMEITLDEPPTMDANFEIAEMQPEGDGSSIGNIAPMNPDAPLHAEDFDAEESQENLGQATQEESVPAIIGPSQEAYGQEGEAAQELPIAQTVPTPIISAVDMNVEPIDNLSSFNGGDILSQMESNLGERPPIMADFTIRPYELFGQGRSIGNIAPMNPDVPFASEDDDDDDDDFDAETLSSQEIEEMAQIPPAVCFEEKIPPEVWFNTPLPSQMEYAETKNEGVLNCPQCGISKADLRGQGGYCGITDPEGEEYNESISCPYNKYFAPQHWIEEPQVISHITPDEIILKPTLQVEMDMPPINQLKAGITKKLIPTYIFNRVNDLLPESVIGEQTPDGMNYNLTYYAMDEDAVNQVIESKEAQVNDIMFGVETFEAPKSRLSKKQQETLDYIKESTMRTGRAYITGETYNMRVIRNLFDKKLIKFDREDNQYKYNWKKPSRVIENDGVYYVVPTSLGNEYTYRFPYGNYQYSSMKEFYDNQKPVFDGTTQTLDEVLDELFGADTRLCNCNVSMPRHSGVHPMTCIKCKFIIESEGFEAETFEAEKKPSKTAEKAILTGASTGATMEIADALLAAEDDDYDDYDDDDDYEREQRRISRAKDGFQCYRCNLWYDTKDEVNMCIQDCKDFDAESFKAPRGWGGRMSQKRRWNDNHVVWASDSKLVRQALKEQFPDYKFGVSIIDGQYIQVVVKGGDRPANLDLFREEVETAAMKPIEEAYEDLPEELRDKSVYVMFYDSDFGTNSNWNAETFNADSNVLTLDEAFPSKSFETPVIEPHPDHENYYMICEDCGNPYEVEKLRFTGDGEWIASYSNHRPETNGMCDSLLDFNGETFESEGGLEERMMNYPESVWCETSKRSRPIPENCDCEYCKVRTEKGWIVCPECEIVCDGIAGQKWYEYEHYDGCEMFDWWNENESRYYTHDELEEQPMGKMIPFWAESFNVEFDDWADQEMKTHGDNISFKKWAKEEGEKHGDVPLTDWLNMKKKAMMKGMGLKSMKS